MEPQRWYIRMRGKVMGPFDAAKLGNMLRRGHFSRMHEISTDRVEWSPASSLAELFAAPATRAASNDERPVAASATNSAEGQWHYTVGGQQHGPVTLDLLRQLTREGQITARDQVWGPGMSTWQSPRNVPELQIDVASQPRKDFRMRVVFLATIVLSFVIALAVFLIFEMMAWQPVRPGQ